MNWKNPEDTGFMHLWEPVMPPSSYSCFRCGEDEKPLLKMGSMQERICLCYRCLVDGAAVLLLKDVVVYK